MYLVTEVEGVDQTEQDKQIMKTNQIPKPKVQGKPFTQLELDIIITNLRKHVAPLPDNLNTIII